MKTRIAMIAVLFFSIAAFAANEISVSWNLTAAKGNLYVTRAQTKQFNITNAAPNVSQFTILVSTAAAGTAISPGYVSTNGWGWLLNTATNTPTNMTSGANTVDVGAQVGGTFYPVLRLYPGEGFPLRFAPGITNWARANTGTNTPVVLECPIIDN